MEEVTVVLAWSHDNVPLPVNLTTGVKLHLEATEYGVYLHVNTFSTRSFPEQQFFKQPHHYGTGR